MFSRATGSAALGVGFPALKLVGACTVRKCAMKCRIYCSICYLIFANKRRGKKYIVRLTGEERSVLKAVVKKTQGFFRKVVGIRDIVQRVINKDAGKIG